MPNQPPTHLHISNHLNEAGVFTSAPFGDDELIYRSFNGNQKYPKDEFFSEISTAEVDNGISVNRQYYCTAPTDVLWRNEHAPIDDEISSCNYNKREGVAIYSIYDSILEAIPPCAIAIAITHSWVKCNVAHCDIILNPSISTLSRNNRRDVRVFLASLFKSIE
jgi:hypothetical protein